jgi:hypothetical protein
VALRDLGAQVLERLPREHLPGRLGRGAISKEILWCNSKEQALLSNNALLLNLPITPVEA